MYTEIGSFNAKAQLSLLLQEVRRGKRYTITLRGHPIADLIPSQSRMTQDVHAAVQAMREITKVQGVSAKNLKDWIQEGRR